MAKKKRVYKKKKEVVYPLFKEVNLSNKGRKGKYMYVKLKKGGRPAYFKFSDEASLQNYMDAYQRKLRYKKEGVLAKSPKAYARKVSRRKEIEDLLKIGYSEAEFTSFEKFTPLATKNAYIKLLMTKAEGFKHPPVADKELAELLSRPENVAGWKKRIEYRVKLMDENNKEIGTFIHIGGKNLDEVRDDFKGEVNTGMEVQERYFKQAKVLEKKGWTYSQKGSGVVKRLDIKLIFRKGK